MEDAQGRLFCDRCGGKGNFRFTPIGMLCTACYREWEQNYCRKCGVNPKMPGKDLCGPCFGEFMMS